MPVQILERNRNLMDAVVDILVEKKSLQKEEFFNLVKLHGSLQPMPPSVVDLRSAKRLEFQDTLTNQKEVVSQGRNWARYLRLWRDHYQTNELHCSISFSWKHAPSVVGMEGVFWLLRLEKLQFFLLICRVHLPSIYFCLEDPIEVVQLWKGNTATSDWLEQRVQELSLVDL